MGAAVHLGRVPDVSVLGGNVEVAADDERFVGVAQGIKAGA